MNIEYVLLAHGIGKTAAGKDKTPPPQITGFTATGGNAQVVLTWVNPIDTDFVGVKILRKEGSYPTGVIDGTVVYVGANTSYTDTTVINGTTYYYRAFAYDWDSNLNMDLQQVMATPAVQVIYGVKIDTLNSNPATALTYTDNAIGFTPALGNNEIFNAGSWADKFPFNAIKPCLFLNGVVNYYLNPNNYAQKIDGVTASDIISGIDGDVMIEFPKVYWKFETIGTDIYIRYSNFKIDEGYKCLGHTSGIVEHDKLYISAYLGYNLASQLRSLSGFSPSSHSLHNFRVYARAIGAEVMNHFQYLMLQILFVVMFKNINSQGVFSSGYTTGNVVSAVTGLTNEKGLFYGSISLVLQNKFCGIEDFYGNMDQVLDGIYYDANRNILLSNENYDDVGTGYTNYGSYGTVNASLFLKVIQGTTEMGFINKGSVGGASTTYYCDTNSLGTLSVPFVGGYFGQTANYGGVFHVNALNSASITAAYVGARTVCLS